MPLRTVKVFTIKSFQKSKCSLVFNKRFLLSLMLTYDSRLRQHFFKDNLKMMDREGKVQSINNYNTWRRKILVWDNSPGILTNIDPEKQGQWRLRNECVFLHPEIFPCHLSPENQNTKRERLDKTSETCDLRLQGRKHFRISRN